jgi:(5-formylfuran-3-yl)methyl phosphate synthase
MAIPDLLVSVRNLDEARAAVDGGCDRLDVKEPERGPLGMADRDIIAEIAAFSQKTHVQEGIPCSVALGEIKDLRQANSGFSPPRGVTDIKLGPAGTQSLDRWTQGWRDVFGRSELRQIESIGRVAVAYADWQLAEAPPPEEILTAAIELGANTFLVDTCRKKSGGLRDALSDLQLRRLSATAHAGGLTFALAGSLRLRDIAALVEFHPDVIAVRGAACHGESRTSEVSGECVQQLKAEICACFSPGSKAPHYARP